MSTTGRALALVLSTAFFLFSTYIYITTGDWVAAVFALGSLAYGLFFLSAATRRDT